MERLKERTPISSTVNCSICPNSFGKEIVSFDLEEAVVNNLFLFKITVWIYSSELWSKCCEFFSKLHRSCACDGTDIIKRTKKYFKKIQENQGKQYPVLLISLLILIFIPTLSFIFGGSSFEIEYPVLKKLSQSSYTFVGGLAIPPEFIALFLALSLYTGAFIAECVRAGIEGISKGQKEAAASIGLSQKQVLNLVVLPQALRIIIPPTTNQYLNLTKNSSLAAAIAYPDVVLVFAGTALMQTGRAIEIVSITMFTYLSISLSISAFMNYYNKKVAITEK